MSFAGALQFGRYAFPPNRLGYCGPDDNQALLEQVADGRPDGGLLQLERRFEGAYPSLCLLAQAQVRVALPKLEPVLGAGSEHPERLVHAASHQIIY